jgi:hypothetical protein
MIIILSQLKITSLRSKTNGLYQLYKQNEIEIVECRISTVGQSITAIMKLAGWDDIVIIKDITRTAEPKFTVNKSKNFNPYLSPEVKRKSIQLFFVFTRTLHKTGT